jgi:hypothetical protein
VPKAHRDKYKQMERKREESSREFKRVQERERKGEQPKREERK